MAKRKRNSYGSIIHEEGFTITQKELKELKYLTSKANRQRSSSVKKYMDALHYDPQMRNVTEKGRAEQLERTGYINEQYKTSLAQFKSKEDLKQHLSDLKEVTSRGYWNRQLKDTRDDMYRKVLEKTDNKKLAKDISKLSNEELASINLTNPSFKEAIWDSDQQLSLDEWNNKIESELTKFLKNRAKFKSKK